jgi:hypothetical protein
LLAQHLDLYRTGTNHSILLRPLHLQLQPHNQPVTSDPLLNKDELSRAFHFRHSFAEQEHLLSLWV